MWYQRVILLCLIALGTADDVPYEVEDDVERDGKLSIFQVVKFANSECTGSTKNGTCFTKAECDNIGGVNSGSCADGFGVCCVMTISNGQSSSVNNTYIEMSSDQSSGAVQYTICPCSDDICRIKFDFSSFTLAAPYTGLGTWTKAGPTATNLESVGRCTVDTFHIVSPSGRSSPTICGTNENQHMILEASNDECLTVNVGLGAITSVTRDLDIRVTQYRCGEEAGGPPGCLQYFQNTSGKIRSFNFPDATAGTTVGYAYAVHLVNQHYKTCIRRANGYEVICWIPCTYNEGEDANADNMKVTNQPSFGLSVNSATVSGAATDTICSNDYIWIPMGLPSTQFSSTIAHQDKPPEADAKQNGNRYCGHILSPITEAVDAALITAAVSVCSYQVPFELGVDFDDRELCSANTNALTCESVVTSASIGGGGGILGFSLCYVQHIPPVS